MLSLSKITAIGVSLMLFCAARSVAQAPFSVQSATKKYVRSGIAGGASYTDYAFRLRITTAKDIRFDSVLVNGSRYALLLSADKPGSAAPKTVKQNDIITVKTQVLGTAEAATATSSTTLIYSLGNARRTFLVKRVKAVVVPASE